MMIEPLWQQRELSVYLTYRVEGTQRVLRPRQTSWRRGPSGQQIRAQWPVLRGRWSREIWEKHGNEDRKIENYRQGGHKLKEGNWWMKIFFIINITLRRQGPVKFDKSGTYQVLNRSATR